MQSKKKKPKWLVEELLQFDGNPKNWVKWIKNTEAIMGQKGHKNIMESKIEANEELNCILLTAVLDGTAHYVVAACEDRSRYQEITTLKK